MQEFKRAQYICDIEDVMIYSAYRTTHERGYFQVFCFEAIESDLDFNRRPTYQYTERMYTICVEPDLLITMYP